MVQEFSKCNTFYTLYDQEEKVKEKLNLPQNCTIRCEKVKCGKDCKHNTHKYYYAYIWDCNSKKLKKKYIGKKLPSPTANITDIYPVS